VCCVRQFTETGLVLHCLVSVWMGLLDVQLAVITAYIGGADKSLARPGRKQATATEDFEFYISYL
jgi:hypothetical protein